MRPTSSPARSSSELVSSLRHTELVRSKFSRIHAVHQVLFARNTLSDLDGFVAKASVETFVPGVVENAEHPAFNSGLTCRAGQGLEFFRSLLAKLKPRHVSCEFVGKFLSTSLDCEILLCPSNLLFARIPVLGNQVAGKA